MVKWEEWIEIGELDGKTRSDQNKRKKDNEIGLKKVRIKEEGGKRISSWVNELIRFTSNILYKKSISKS